MCTDKMRRGASWFVVVVDFECFGYESIIIWKIIALNYWIKSVELIYLVLFKIWSERNVVLEGGIYIDGRYCMLL
jgi:hypothetical protein